MRRHSLQKQMLCFSNLVDYNPVPYGAMVSKGVGTTLILLAKSALPPNKKLYWELRLW